MASTSSPPPYIIDLTQSDEEDQLPGYTTTLHLATLARRKLEFTAPNVPASKSKGERSWDFCWLVLSGTALYVYQPKRNEVRAHVKHEEETRAARIKEHKAHQKQTQEKKKEKEVVTSSPATSRPSTRTGVYTHPDSAASSTAELSRSTTRHSFASASSSSVHKLPLFDDAPAPASDGGKPKSAITPPADFSAYKLLKQYSLHSATCTRALDYLRRYFVLRVHAEGQQFMVQLNSHLETLEWLAAFPVSADLCLDLDERPMPEPPVYPRRHRHPADTVPSPLLVSSSIDEVRDGSVDLHRTRNIVMSDIQSIPPRGVAIRMNL